MILNVPALSDFHAHYRQGEMLDRVAPFANRYAGRTLAMPNLVPPISDVVGAMAYAARLRLAMPAVDVRVAIKLLPGASPESIVAVGRERVASAAKLYPAGATTHSADGIPHAALADPDRHTRLGDQIDAVCRAGMVLCLHGEMPLQEDPLRREEDFLPFVDWVLDRFPKLRVVLEHITTAEAANFVRERSSRGLPVAATITAHHLLLHLGHLMGCVSDGLGYDDGKLHPHLFCWPVAKVPRHKEALVAAATSGLPCYFLGSDTAPHPRSAKEAGCGCAGVFSSPVLPEILVDLFEGWGAVDRLPDFATHFGDRFYRLAGVSRSLRMRRESWTVPEYYPGPCGDFLVPFLAGRTLRWTLEE